MEEATDDNIYVLGDSFMESADQLMSIQDDFSPRKKRHIFTLEDLNGIGEDDILIGDDADDDILLLQKRIKLEHDNIPALTPVVNFPVEPGPSNSSLRTETDEPDQLLFPLDEDNGLSSDKVDEGYIVEHIDIRSPVSVLQNMLEKRLDTDLSGYAYWLQNAQKLDPNKNLVEQCIQGEGLVQINIELKESEKRINIVDVLKPTEEFLEAHKQKTAKKSSGIQWMVDSVFRKEMARLEIPEDPRQWSREQVKLWFIWAVRQFNIVGVKLSDWLITGQELCEMQLETFRQKCPKDREDIFWTHLELLRKCRLLAVVAKPEDRVPVAEEEVVPVFQTPEVPPQPRPVARVRETPKKSRILGSNSVINERRTGLGNSKLGNNGQIQLWQFLLELLTDKVHRNVIYWVSDDGEFKLEDPEMVAQLWGLRKNKPAMTYEKLSRALRYYYDGDMIAKVHGKRFVYKFVCDLTVLLGYSASDLNRLVTECAKKHGLLTTPNSDCYVHTL